MQIVKKFKDLPWQDLTYEDTWYASYDVSTDADINYKVFVPKETTPVGLNAAFLAAYSVGNMMISSKKIAAFQLIMKIGKDAGQDISWPYIQLLPFNIPTN